MEPESTICGCFQNTFMIHIPRVYVLKWEMEMAAFFMFQLGFCFPQLCSLFSQRNICFPPTGYLFKEIKTGLTGSVLFPIDLA